MKKLLPLIFSLLLVSAYGQENKIEVTTKYDFPELGSREFFIESFQGIEKIDVSISDNQKIAGKNFKLIIRKYRNGKPQIEKVVHDTKKEELPKIGKEFKFSIIAQQTFNKERIGFMFPNFMNKSSFNVDQKYSEENANTFLMRTVTKIDKINLEIGKETQIALITPPNDDENAGELGYCEISKGYIDINEWYKKYKLTEFFMIYLVIQD
ncbi:hypothetical protein [Flavobacterium hungaricum]|uniref:Uncharacterized protein n=1 Tax=Flavobacterium hungaricum TaxID=2082725 RepID=A0ABR9TF01_9FLAO|nr:hypothetical protein [Flavobacterium hungaricum]MBE8723627.1 hypothetical protein [Flavobacterium hungaricum]